MRVLGSDKVGWKEWGDRFKMSMEQFRPGYRSMLENIEEKVRKCKEGDTGRDQVRPVRQYC